MVKIITYSLLSLVLMSACTGNRFLKQRYTHFKNKKHSTEVVVKTTPAPAHAKKLEFPATVPVKKEADQQVLASAEEKKEKTPARSESSTVKNQVNSPQASAAPLKISALNEKQLTKKEQKKFLFGLIESVLGLVLSILLIVLVVLLILYLV